MLTANLNQPVQQHKQEYKYHQQHNVNYYVGDAELKHVLNIYAALHLVPDEDKQPDSQEVNYQRQEKEMKVSDIFSVPLTPSPSRTFSVPN